MKLHTRLLYGIIIPILVLAACQPVHHRQPPPTVTADTASTPIAGTWYNDEDIFGCMTLTITDSGRFSFYEAGGNVNRYSAGTIHRDGNELHFTSDAQYRSSTSQSMGDTMALRRMAAANRFPHPGDTLSIYLDSEHYLLDGDTLYKLDPGGFKTDMKFHR